MAKAPAPTDAKGRFVSKYDPELARAVCERIAEGESLSAICRDERMPDRKTFRRWVVAHEELRQMYEAARELQAHSVFDEALDLARRLTVTPDEGWSRDEVNAMRVALDHMRWTAGKLNPREYGDRAQPGPALAIQINTTLDLGASGRERGPAPGENLYSISATIVPPAAGQEASEPDVGPVEVPSVADGRRAKRPSRAQQP